MHQHQINNANLAAISHSALRDQPVDIIKVQACAHIQSLGQVEPWNQSWSVNNLWNTYWLPNIFTLSCQINDIHLNLPKTVFQATCHVKKYNDLVLVELPGWVACSAKVHKPGCRYYQPRWKVSTPLTWRSRRSGSWSLLLWCDISERIAMEWIHKSIKLTV